MPLNLDPVLSGYNLSVINDNFQKIDSVWDEKLDRLVSTQSNQMEQELDLNSNKLINVGNGFADSDGINVGQAKELITGSGISGGSVISETPPSIAVNGQRWTRCADMVSFIWYADEDGGQWVEDNPSMGTTRDGLRVVTTVGVLATGVFAVGTSLELSDRGNTPFKVVSGGIADGFGVLNAGAGNTAVPSNPKKISAVGCGYSDTNTAAQNKSALKSAVSRCVRGGTLTIEDTGAVCNIDTTLGESDAVVVSVKIKIKCHSQMKANYGILEANAATIFNLAAKGIVLTGSGCIFGSGTIDDTNAGDTFTIPSLILITADECRVSIDIDTPPKAAINIRNCFRCRVTKSTHRGGLLSYTVGNTAYFSVYLHQGGKHKIFSNFFIPSDTGGRFTSCVFSVGSNGNEIHSNTADKPFEKLVYLYGDDNQIHDNQCYGDPAIITGTTLKGTVTSVYRVNGSRNKISNNYSFQCLAGATFLEGDENEVSNNRFLLCSQAGVTSFSSTGAAIWSSNVIKNNLMTAWVGDTGATLLAGIYTWAGGEDFSSWTIRDNESSGFTDGTSGDISSVDVGATTPYSVVDFTIKGNKSKSCNHGISTTRTVDSEIAENSSSSIVGYSLRENGGARNKWLNNSGRALGNNGISGLSATSDARGNSYTDAPTANILTLEASAITTIAHGGVAPNAKVFLQEAGFSAGVLTATTGVLTDVSGTGFRVLTGNGGGAAGTEQFWYRIEQ